MFGTAKKHVWALYTSDAAGETITLHETQGEALDQLTATYGIKVKNRTDAQIDNDCNALGVTAFAKRVRLP